MKQIIIALIILISLSSCLKLQDSFEYQANNSSGETNLSAWDYIKSRPDIFSSLRDLVRLTDNDSTLYMQESAKHTYLLINNTGMNTAISNFNADNETAFATWDEAIANNKTWIKNMLRFHIVDGYYHSLGTLFFDPLYVVTLWKSQNATLWFQLSKGTSYSSYGIIRINRVNTVSDIGVTPVTSNLFNTNGVSHVIPRPVRTTYK